MQSLFKRSLIINRLISNCKSVFIPCHDVIRARFSPLLVAGVPVICLGVILHIVAMATSAWTHHVINSDQMFQITSMGPWRTCGPVAVHLSSQYVKNLHLNLSTPDLENTKQFVYSDQDACGSTIVGFKARELVCVVVSWSVWS